MERAAEYGEATDRVNKALATLKAELVELRSQDVHLMKQLITINDTIRELTPKKDHKINRKTYFYSSRRGSCFGLHMLPDNCMNGETPLLRRQSAPNFSNLRRCNSSSSCSTVSLSSIEDVSFPEEGCTFEIGSDIEENISCNNNRVSQDSSYLPRAKSFCVEPKGNFSNSDSCYEDILMSNVKLWKYTQCSNISEKDYDEISDNDV